jgi:hypothetical protein
LGIAYDWLSADRLEIILAASAVTGSVGPGNGWGHLHARLLQNAIGWARTGEDPTGD